MPKPYVISVVVPSHDRGPETWRAVRSVLDQTLPAREIVVIDDASATRLDPAAFETLSPRIRVIRLESNRGAAGARQAGIDAVRGDAVAFLDSDDVWHPAKLAEQIALLAPMTAVACGWDELDAEGRRLRTRHPIEAGGADAFFAGCWFCPGSTVLIEKATLERVGPLDARLGRLEDLEWYARFGLAGGRLRVAPMVGVDIAVGGRARMAPVSAARARILETFRDAPGVTAGARRDLRAYLRVEMAKAARNEGHRAVAARHMAASFMLRPRRRLHLRDWWAEAAAGGAPS